MRSLKSGLARALLWVMVPIWLLLALGSYWSVMIEVDEIYDQQLRELATPLLNLTVRQIEATWHGDARARNEDDDDRSAVRVWDLNGALVFASPGAPSVAFASRPVAEPHAVQKLRHGHVRWLMHWYFQPEHGRWMAIMRPMTERDELAVALGAGLAMPAVLAVVMMLPLGAWAIRRGLRPLQMVGAQVASRRSQDLSTIDATQVVSEVVPLVQEINGLLERLDVALSAEKRFTSDASHELRTPLAAARAHIEVAMGSQDDSARQRALTQALKGLAQASELTEQLLLLARLDHQSHAAWTSSVDLGALLRELSATHGVQALGMDVSLGLTLPPHACHVMGHAAWLSVAVGNLLANAVKFTPAGGQVDVSLVDTGDAVRIHVRDSGPGVPGDQLQALGQRFARGRHDLPGAGLGLSIATRIVDLHGGTLHFENEGGLHVTLMLPKAAQIQS